MAVRMDGPSRPKPPTTGAFGPDALEAKKAQQAAAETSTDGATPAATWNADTRPIVIGQTSIGSYSDFVPGHDRVDSEAFKPAWSNVHDAMDLLSQIRTGSPDQYALVVAQMRAAGYLGPRANSRSSVEAAWKSVLEDGASLYAQHNGRREANVFDWLAQQAATGAELNSQTGGGYGGSGSESSTVVDVNFTNPDTAKGVLNAAMAQYLGRDAKPGELQKFISALKGHEAADPTVTTTKSGTSTTGTAASHATTSTASRVTEGGTNSAQFAEDWARSQEGSGEHVAATRLLDGFMKAIQNPQGVL